MYELILNFFNILVGFLRTLEQITVFLQFHIAPFHERDKRWEKLQKEREIEIYKSKWVRWYQGINKFSWDKLYKTIFIKIFHNIKRFFSSKFSGGHCHHLPQRKAIRGIR